MFFKNNIVNHLFLESAMLNDEFILDNQMTQDVEKDYIVLEKIPQNVTLMCKIVLKNKTNDYIHFDLNVNNKRKNVNFVENSSYIEGIKLVVEGILLDDDENQTNFEGENQKFYAYFLKNNVEIPIKKSNILCDLKFKNLTKNTKIKMDFVNVNRDIKNIVTHPEARYIRDTEDYLFFYGGRKCEENMKNFKQFYVKFYIKKGEIFKELYEYGEVKQKFPQEFSKDPPGYECDGKIFINDFNDFLRSGGLKFFLKYHEQECEILSQLSEKMNKKFETFFEYYSSEAQYFCEEEDKILIKFELKK